MVRLESLALKSEPRQAALYWQQRESTQWLRSLLLRDIWAHDRQHDR